MVSTRGLKYKFSEGEKVLCYEPDPAKTKVLYNSKVLQIIVSKGENGKKFNQLLIHFQGWNSAWDRFVTEEYVLKDTEENRKLQRELAEKAQLTAGGNLYRRKRKTRMLSDRSSRETSLEAKRCHSSPVPVSEGEGPGTVEESTGGEEEEEEEEQEEEEQEEEEQDEPVAIVLTLSDTLACLLEVDHELVTKKNKLAKLPAEPNVVRILEGFVKHYAGQLCGSPVKSPYRKGDSAKERRSTESIWRDLNRCKEVVDGIRIYFDFTLGELLLYRQEREQRQQATLMEPESCSEVAETPENADKINQIQENHQVDHAESPWSEDAERRRSLRSHRGWVEGEAEECLQVNGTSMKPRIPSVDIKQETLSSVASTSSHDWTPRPANNKKAYAVTTADSPERKAVLLHTMSWKVVPDSFKAQKPTPPSLIYGATHLARLFVKLADLLQSTNMAEEKHDVLLDYIEKFLTYLEEHSEWFGEEHYLNNPAASPTDDVSN